MAPDEPQQLIDGYACDCQSQEPEQDSFDGLLGGFVYYFSACSLIDEFEHFTSVDDSVSVADSPGIVFEVLSEILTSTALDCHMWFRHDEVGSSCEAEVRVDDMGVFGEIDSNEEGRVDLGCDCALAVVQLGRVVVLFKELSAYH